MKHINCYIQTRKQTVGRIMGIFGICIVALSLALMFCPSNWAYGFDATDDEFNPAGFDATDDEFNPVGFDATDDEKPVPNHEGGRFRVNGHVEGGNSGVNKGATNRVNGNARKVRDEFGKGGNIIVKEGAANDQGLHEQVPILSPGGNENVHIVLHQGQDVARVIVECPVGTIACRVFAGMIHRGLAHSNRDEFDVGLSRNGGPSSHTFTCARPEDIGQPFPGE